MEQYTHVFTALGSANKIVVIAESSAEGRAYCLCAEEEVRRIESKYSRYQPDSVLTEINRNAATRPVSVDGETAELLNYAAACYKQSGGLFDITSGALRRIWDFKAKRIPTESEISQVCKMIGWQHVAWKSPVISFRRKEMELDLGGIGKEYAVDQAVHLLQASGVAGGYVNLGGDLRSWGKPLDRDCWSFGLAHPRKEGAVFRAIELTEGALATSGDYERYFEHEGKRYCHILNPKTGWPINELQSVSVIAPACILAGSCATIAMLLGRTKGLRFLQKMEFPFVVIDAAGSVIEQ